MTSNIILNKEDRVMLLAVHPDDETLSAGGLLQRAVALGAAVRVIFITDGDNNAWPQRFLEGHWHINGKDRIRWGKRRRYEALAALSALNVDIKTAVFLGLPDQGITSLLTSGGEAVIKRLAKEFTWKPTLLLIPALNDRHPDHNALSILADFALKRVPNIEANLSRLAYLIHGRQTFSTTRFSIKLSPQEVENKRRAILCHHTQTALGRRRFLRYAKPEEIYFSTIPAESYYSTCPLYRATVEDSHVKFNVGITRLAYSLSNLTLYIVADHPEHLIRLKLMFNKESEISEIVDSTTGSVIGQSRISIKNNMVEAMIPLEQFPDVDYIYFKLESRWSFLDLAGWNRVLIPRTEPRHAINIVGVIPCFNVEDYCEDVVLQALHFVDHIVIIDDGSNDNTPAILANLIVMFPDNISLISFPHNQGKGVALIAGFFLALKKFDFKTLVTLDADGQHSPTEIPSLVAMIENGAELVIGGRQLAQMPGRSRLGNTIAASALRWLYPMAPNDTQSGLRAFNQAFTKDIVRWINGSRYETEFQILLLALSEQRQIASVPIATIYIDNNRSSKFRPITDSLNILWALICWRMGF